MDHYEKKRSKRRAAQEEIPTRRLVDGRNETGQVRLPEM
jgi:hypothetical protein